MTINFNFNTDTISVTSATFTFVNSTSYGLAQTGNSATQSNVSLVASSGDTNTSVVLTPKGTGALIAGPAPDGTTTGGNARGIYATDFQVIRTTSSRVASGAYSAVFGSDNTASNNNSFAAGSGNTASGENTAVFGNLSTASGGQSFAAGYSAAATNASIALGAVVTASGFRSVSLGDTATASGSYSTTFGYYSNARSRYGYLAQGSGQFSSSGDAQHGIGILRAATSAATLARLTADAGAAGSANIINLVNNSALRLTIDIVGRDTTNGDTGLWKIESGIKRGANAAATALVGTPIVTVVGLDSGWALQASPTLTADTTNGGLNLSITPITTNACRWVARVMAVEVA